ncbi:2-amino-4-hydroxy-6-hydroxymethyldihydropteridine diphosphokinase [Qipengyuania spongiae]|uniref:2-amino-4-hydroxy-6-hydroxymethyldihydropteridine pyrophosphokinase n=1 Tax=Qipengyuania spongiae TaxID=2909673 RepID=A0ABY5SZD0_9SPHN|nr:2-amino-4-hydroxy-6-hydroxymethyldihydropteridine diphosphokinase [Qipengyuania spongiae]UVI39614.1 2-amino-4-hydroxy-6-hydroxymethyldihydropteridine diphosphokinase [Qipengyuania spongiae]
MRLPGVGGPRHVLDEAIQRIEDSGARVEKRSRTISSRPIGPSSRTYANSAAQIASPLDPPGFLAMLQGIERDLGRTRRGAAWRARTIDLDIVLWNGGIWRSDRLAIPHPRFRERRFVLGPLAEIAPCWRDPESHLAARYLFARLTRPNPLPRCAPWSGP